MHGRRNTIAVLALAAATAAQKPPASDPLTVHEWGTFTSMQGPDGVWLEGLHHEEEALPAFVHTMGNTEGEVRRTKGGVDVVRVTRKMETPVISLVRSSFVRTKMVILSFRSVNICGRISIMGRMRRMS